MKKILPIAALTSLVLTFTPAILAQDSTPSTTTSRSSSISQKLDNRQNVVAKRLENKQLLVASRAAELKAKLDAFKNQVKAQVAQKVSENLNKINANRTAAMIDNLQKMTTILDKLEKKTTEASSSGNNASASAAIANARNAITTAQDAVTAQSEKDYTVSVTTEAKVRIDVKSTRDQLFKDLQNTKKLVISAKQSVADAISSVRSEREAK